MSNTLYPLGLIASQKITPVNSVIADAFEDGSTSTRALWSPQNFKRFFMLQHASLTLAEFKYLRSFYSQRSGTLDSFWYRDNINREGNALVRFTPAPPNVGGSTIPFQKSRDGSLYAAAVQLGEIAPIRALPEWDEVTTAAGVAPALWYDANREFYLSHLGSVLFDPAGAYDAANQKYPAPWQSANAVNNDGSMANQYQQYAFLGTGYAKTGINISEIAGAQPACTVFAIAQQSSTTNRQVLFGLGTTSPTAALGIQLTAANKYAPWIGGTETWTAAAQTNPNNTWQSVAAVFPGSTNTASLYVNAALIGTDTNTRSYSAGPAALGAATDGSSICNPSNTMPNCKLAHALVFPGALSLAQIKALHNLLGYQYGLAIVP
jgi:hypothetical protein